jgi:GTPase SAR1 family protein
VTLLNPLTRRKCPTCLGLFYLSECRIVSDSPERDVLEEAPRGLQKYISRFWLKSVSGQIYAEKQARRQCPLCGALLPHNIEYMQDEIIALVGSAGSGKSHYIASLIRELRGGDVLTKIGCTGFAPLDQTVEDLYRSEYFEPLFRDRRVLGQTHGGTERPGPNIPLIYEMVFSSKSALRSTRRINLVLYDASGEDLQVEDKLLKYQAQVLHASALIVLIDPLALPGFYLALPPHLRPAEVPNRDAFDVLDRVTRVYRREKGIAPGMPINIPVVLTLAKSDLVRYVMPRIGRFSATWNPNDYSEGFNIDDFRRVSDEVQQVLLRFAGPDFLQSITMTYPNITFSAITATGISPDKGRYKTVKPRRCIDPLFWILWRLGIMHVARPRNVEKANPRVGSAPQEEQAGRA